MHIETRQFYEFGPFHLDVNERLLMREGRMVPLSPKVFDTLLVLVENGGRILGKDELMQMIWPDTFVEESNLTHNISQIRRALGDGEYIETVPRRGYRFVFQVQSVRREPQDAGTVETSNGASEDAFVLTNGIGGDSSSNGTIADSDNSVPEIARFARQADEGQPDVEAKPPTLDPKKLDPRSRMMLAAMLFGSLSVAAVALFVASRQAKNHAQMVFRQINPAKLTTSGEALGAAVSRDGKYVAYVARDGNRQSLRVRQTAAMSNAQVVAPEEIVFKGVTFAPDDSSIYYVARPKGESVGRLYQVPVLGGTPKQLMSGVDSPITLSPDGRYLAFVRDYPAQREVSLITARLDGSEERKLVTRKGPEMLSLTGPSWSPDGRVIACVSGSLAGLESTAQVLAVHVADGSSQPIGDQTWQAVGQVAWLGDGSGIAFSAWRRSSAVYAGPLWLMTYPKAEVRQITSDLTTYDGASLSADSRALVTHRMDRVSRIWIMPVSGGGFDTEQATQLQSGFGDNFSEWLGLDWTPDGRLVYASQASGNLDIWTAAADGRQQRQLTRDAVTDVMPTASADGRYIVFVSDRSGHSNIWRMDVDGGNLKQLTRGRGDFSPDLSPDGKWVVYSSWSGGEPALWKTPIDGGEPVRLNLKFTVRPVVSPDGKWIAGFYQDEKENKGKVAVSPFAGGEPRVIEEMTLPEFGLLRWSLDSRALTYIVTRQGVANIWSQPIDGGEAKQLTRFTTDRIFRFAWARDGKHLACERGLDIHDIVLLNSNKSE